MNPIEYIKHEIKARGVSKKYVCKSCGLSESHFSEVINCKRKITLSQIQGLVFGLGMDASILIQDYEI
jgi:antitoxin component HigA of HigAB toxin-antitoxin module